MNLEELKLEIISRMVFLTPHPRDEDGKPIPLFRDEDGNITDVTPKDLDERIKEAQL